MSDQSPATRPVQVARMEAAAREAVMALARNNGDESAAAFRRAFSVVRGAVHNATPQEREDAMKELSS
jgi:hypothetical protein